MTLIPTKLTLNEVKSTKIILNLIKPITIRQIKSNYVKFD